MSSQPALESLSPGPRNRLRAGFFALIASIWVAFPALGAGPAAAAKPAESAQVEALKKNVRDNPSDPHAVVQLAEEYHRQGQDDNTTLLLWKQVEKLDANGFMLLMNAHEARKEWNEVIRAANFLLGKNPKNEAALTRLGNAQLQRGRKSDAKEPLKKALEINKAYQPAYDVLIKVYEDNPYEQRLLLQDMVETFGPKITFLTKLCTLNTMDGENEQGEKICTQAIKVDTNVPENHVHLGIIAKQKGEPEKAKTLLQTAADEFPNSEYAQYQYASFVEADKNYVDAYNYFERCLKADMKSERCLMGVGNNGVQLSKFDRSMAAFKLACQKNGRKNAAAVRKAFRLLQQRKEFEWASKFESLTEKCSMQ